MCLSKLVQRCFGAGALALAMLSPEHGAAAETKNVEEIVAAYKAQHYAFAERLDTCRPFEQSFDDPLSGQVLKREVLGQSDEGCRMVQDVYGPERLLCTIPAPELPAFTAAWRALADNIKPDGSYRIQYSSSNPDPLTQFYNSEKCKQIKKVQ